MLKVTAIDKESIAEELGFEIGDRITKINGCVQEDLMDYAYAESQEELTIEVLTKDGEEVVLEIEKDADDVLGLEFADNAIEPRKCRNNCLFCFVAQLPKGMRKTLYVKDDDWRLSCICGNYVTLTNVSDEEFEKICKMKVSPLYVSVHAYTPETRASLLRNPKTVNLFERLQKLSDCGVKLHAQIVLVKGVNDGEELKLTLKKLYGIKNVLSVAVVPVGLTGHRERLTKLEQIDEKTALETIEATENVGQKNGQPFAFSSDEMYLKAKKEIPPYEYYGDFCQFENGVGMIASFRKEFFESLDSCGELKGDFLFVTGVSAYDEIKKAVDELKARWQGITAEVVAVKNKFFGESITVTGLLTGRDIAECVKSAPRHETVVLPSVCVRDIKNVFLDDFTLEELKEELAPSRVIVVDSTKGSGIVEALLGSMQED